MESIRCWPLGIWRFLVHLRVWIQYDDRCCGICLPIEIRVSAWIFNHLDETVILNQSARLENIHCSVLLTSDWKSENWNKKLCFESVWEWPRTMATDYLSSEFKSRLRLTSKTVGADRIRRAKENNEDVAVLSMFLPGSAAKEENARFRCALGVNCRLGDWRLSSPGMLSLFYFKFAVILIYILRRFYYFPNNRSPKMTVYIL